jgi:hypothetical protein
VLLKFINYLKALFITNKIITFKGDLNTLEEMIDEMTINNNDQLFYCIKNQSKEYVFTAVFSVGTLHINDKGQDISLKMYIISESDELQKIWFKGKLNAVHYFILAFFVLSIIFMVINHYKINFWFFPIAMVLWVISHLWFNFFLRGQENAIIDDFNVVLSKKIWKKNRSPKR